MATTGSFVFDCPYCKKENRFFDDEWMDELVDDSQEHPVRCQHCEELMLVEVQATYTHTARMLDEDGE